LLSDKLVIGAGFATIGSAKNLEQSMKSALTAVPILAGVPHETVLGSELELLPKGLRYRWNGETQFCRYLSESEPDSSPDGAAGAWELPRENPQYLRSDL
jgi:hypothetical protein